MKTEILIEDDPNPRPDEPDEDLSTKEKRKVDRFREVVAMLSKFKTRLLRKRLKKEKLKLLMDLLAINKKLDVLDQLKSIEKKDDKK